MGANHDAIENEVDGSQELTEAQIEEFIKYEQVAASEGNNADIYSKYTPQIGMEFKDRNDAHHFFCFYAFLARFEVVVAHVTRINNKKNNEIYKKEMRCHRYGKMTKRGQQEEQMDTLLVEATNADKQRRKTNIQVKSGGKCVMLVKEIAGVWRVVNLDLDHNHQLSPESVTLEPNVQW